ncbi:MAG: sulfurtransferase TusA family protein [Candidatus Atribacteria bacterium]|nr:sulfurtransferase TusA family protein [Candidatus Atribacteria bacterium]
MNNTINTVDARGLSCPQPVIMTIREIKKVKKGDIAILVDTETAQENVVRAAKLQGWNIVEVVSTDGNYKIVIRREE